MRSNTRINSQLSMYNKELIRTTSNYLCQTILDEEKRRNDQGKWYGLMGLDDIDQWQNEMPRRLYNVESKRETRNNTNSTLIR